jgi:hypothetical protein
MTKLCLIILLTLVGTLSRKCEKNSKPDIVIWSPNTKLTWNDFQGKENILPFTLAESAVDFQLEYKIKNDRLVSFDVRCVLAKSRSWHSDTSGYALIHEQKHFDLGEIYSRQLRRELRKMVGIGEFVSEKRMQELLDLYSDKLSKRQKLYDEETTAPIRPERQTFWNQLILQELEELNEYARNKSNK